MLSCGCDQPLNSAAAKGATSVTENGLNPVATVGWQAQRSGMRMLGFAPIEESQTFSLKPLQQSNFDRLEQNFTINLGFGRIDSGKVQRLSDFTRLRSTATVINFGFGVFVDARASLCQSKGSRQAGTRQTDTLTDFAGASALFSQPESSRLQNFGIGCVLRVPDFAVDTDLIRTNFVRNLNGSVTVKWTVRNNSCQPVQPPSSWLDRFYLSADNQLDQATDILVSPNDQYLNQQSVGANGFYERTETLTFVNPFNRRYLILAVNDSGAAGRGQLTEQRYDNNTIVFDLWSQTPIVLGVPESPNANPYNYRQNCSESATQATNSETELHTGALTETHSLAAYQSVGVDRTLTLRYNSLHADARHILHFSHSGVADAPGEQLLIAKLGVQRGSTTLPVPGYRDNQYGLTGGEHFWAIPDGNMSQRIQAALKVDLRNQPSGVYNYTLQRGIQTLDRTTPQFGALNSTDRGTIVHVNRSNSAFGRGWSLAGWQELIVNPDNSVLLIDGDGTERVFQAPTTAGGAYQSPGADQSQLVRLSDGTFQRTMKDRTVSVFNAQNQLTEVRSPNGQRLRYLYNTVGRLQQIIDPAGLTTILTYTGDRVTSIADPANRVTRLTYDAIGNLQRITDPDGTSRTWEYDSQFRMTAEVDQRGNREQTIYDAFGRVDRATRKDNTTINIDPVQVKGLYRPDQTINPLSAPTVWMPTNEEALRPEAIVTDARGNQTRTQLNQGGNVLSQRDAIGSLGSTERNCGCGRVDAVTDGRGNTTRYSYDSRGNLTRVSDSISGSQAKVMTYDTTFNQLTSVTNELGQQTLYQRDTANGNLLAIQQVVGAIGGGDDRITRFTYLSNGLVDTITDPLGRITDYDYDVQGRLIAKTVARGLVEQAIERYEYDGAGNRSALIDANGNRTMFLYDGRNRVIQVTEADPDGAGPLTSPITRYTYDAIGNLTQVTDARGNVTRYEYDAMNRVTQVIEADPDGAGPLTSPMTRYSYDANGNLVRTTNARNASIDYHYDARNRLTNIQDARAGQTKHSSYFYDLNNNLTHYLPTTSFATTPNPVGAYRIQREYDARNRLIQESEVFPSSSSTQLLTTRYQYNAIDQLTQFTRPNGFSTQYAYDQLSRLIRVTDADPDGAGIQTAPITQYTYDLVGNQTSSIDSLGRTTRYQYDGRDRLVQVTLPGPDGAGSQIAPATRYTYDAVGNKLSSRDALGQTTSYRYDALHRPIEVLDPLNQVTRKSYDAVDNLTGITDSLNQRTTYEYDRLNRLIRDTNPLGFSRTYSYDALDNLTETVDRNGRRRTFEYDERDRLTQERWLTSAGQVGAISYAYVIANNGIDQIRFAGDTTNGNHGINSRYDEFGRIAGIDTSDLLPGFRIAYTNTEYAYDAVGNLSTVRDRIGTSTWFGPFWQGARQIDYRYDGLNRVTSIAKAPQAGTTSATTRVDLTYNAASELTSLTRFQGTNTLVATSNYTYDLAGRLDRLTHSRNGTTLADHRLGYDADNRITQLAILEGTTNYSYDARDQLTIADHTNQTDETYRYDVNGNRTNTGYRTGANNQLLSDGVFNYEYDRQGNRTKRTHIANGTIDAYTWDYRNRLTQVVTTDRNGVVIRASQYRYDAFDRRIAKTIDLDGAGAALARTEYYAYDRDHISFVLDDTSNAFGYLYAPGVDQVLFEERSNSEVLWALSDHQGSVRSIIDSNGTTRNRITYDSFGNVTSQTNPNLNFRFGYTGRDFDPETGLNYYRARYYDARAGRFISEDPIGFAAGDTNLSRYVKNDPMNRIDPTGLRDARWPGNFSVINNSSSDVYVLEGNDTSDRIWRLPPGYSTPDAPGRSFDADGVWVNDRYSGLQFYPNGSSVTPDSGSLSDELGWQLPYLSNGGVSNSLGGGLVVTDAGVYSFQPTLEGYVPVGQDPFTGEQMLVPHISMERFWIEPWDGSDENPNQPDWNSPANRARPESRIPPNPAAVNYSKVAWHPVDPRDSGSAKFEERRRMGKNLGDATFNGAVSFLANLTEQVINAAECLPFGPPTL